VAQLLAKPEPIPPGETQGGIPLEWEAPDAHWIAAYRKFEHCMQARHLAELAAAAEPKLSNTTNRLKSRASDSQLIYSFNRFTIDGCRRRRSKSRLRSHRDCLVKAYSRRLQHVFSKFQSLAFVVPDAEDLNKQAR